MKKLMFMSAAALLVLSACGPSQEEIEAAEKAVADSTAAYTAQMEAEAAAVAQAKADSVAAYEAQAKADSTAVEATGTEAAAK